MPTKNSIGKTYAEKASFANVLCTTSSAAGQIGTSLEPIFDSDHTSVVFSNNVSSDITYTANAGTFTFARAGIYHIVLVAHTQQETSNQLQTFEMKLNSASAFYIGERQVNTGYDPVESTHQAVVSIAADDVLHMQMKTAAATATVIQGTSVIITEITSGHYASHQATAAGTNTNIDEFNPFDTNYSGNPASYTTVTAGMTVTATDGSFTVNSAGRYFIMVSNSFVMADQGGGASTILMKLKKGGSAISSQTVAAVIGDDIAENTFCQIENLAATDVMTFTWDTSDATEEDGVRAQKGTTFTIYKLSEASYTNGTTAGFFGYPYISLYNIETDFTATAAEVNPFDTDSYDSANSFSTRAADGITFTAADGKFTVSEPGLYNIIFAPVFSLSTGADVVTKIKVNGTAQVTSTGKVSSDPDPLDKTTIAFLELNKNDFVTVTVDCDGQNLDCDTGTSIAIYRYFGFFKTEDTLASGLISDDLTINTFSQENLSVQHERNTDQVPFRFGIKGAASLRGRTEAPVVKIGDKKS